MICAINCYLCQKETTKTPIFSVYRVAQSIKSSLSSTLSQHTYYSIFSELFDISLKLEIRYVIRLKEAHLGGASV